MIYATVYWVSEMKCFSITFPNGKIGGAGSKKEVRDAVQKYKRENGGVNCRIAIKWECGLDFEPSL